MPELHDMSKYGSKRGSFFGVKNSNTRRGSKNSLWVNVGVKLILQTVNYSHGE